MITNPAIEDYVTKLVSARSPLLAQLEQEAETEGIPIIQLPSAQTIRLLLMLHRPKAILEVGTAIGYSTIWLAEAAVDAKIVTMELDEERIQRAQNNFKLAGLSERIELIGGDATKGLPDHYEFDCLFIDAAKGQYRTFLDLYLPKVRSGGLIICDNILFRGLVAAPEEASKRLRPLVEKIDRFNHHLMERPDLETAILPVGDGLAVSYKR
ncbi:O-methyltransferase [Brevibacillus fulvus]|uniref:tRNA 5-hydroxyuridine methyltransferase n=1 Tax=Brevibacillus fulvus TaxID=1125967 RepID=A0A939BRS5_9BACL|nr:O-methyltransferase [Brevibacillus fulvus]MBM7589952.1 caffeoyl-CoA O-methyltransferase [Brevibacillus fulvus]